MIVGVTIRIVPHKGTTGRSQIFVISIPSQDLETFFLDLNLEVRKLPKVRCKPDKSFQNITITYQPAEMFLTSDSPLTRWIKLRAARPGTTSSE